MSAEPIILPVIRRERYTLDALEQHARELAHLMFTRLTVPPRTRPLLVVDNSRSDGDALRRAFNR